MFADRDRVRAVLLEGHPGRMETDRRDRVTEHGGEEVIRRAVEVLDLLAVELGRDRRAVQTVDPVVGRVGGLVVLGVRVGREEVVRQRELMSVDVQHRRVLPKDLELAVGLGLGPGEPVAVHVEAVQVPPGRRLASVRVLDGQDHDDRVRAGCLSRRSRSGSRARTGPGAPRRRHSPRCRGRWPRPRGQPGSRPARPGPRQRRPAGRAGPGGWRGCRRGPSRSPESGVPTMA